MARVSVIYRLTESHVDNASFVQRIKVGSKISIKERRPSPSDSHVKGDLVSRRCVSSFAPLVLSCEQIYVPFHVRAVEEKKRRTNDWKNSGQRIRPIFALKSEYDKSILLRFVVHVIWMLKISRQSIRPIIHRVPNNNSLIGEKRIG